MENQTRLPAPGITVGVAAKGRAPTGVAVDVSETVLVSGETTVGVNAVTEGGVEGEADDEPDDEEEVDGTSDAEETEGEIAVTLRVPLSSATAWPAHSNVVPSREPTLKARAERASLRMITHRMSEVACAAHE